MALTKLGMYVNDVMAHAKAESFLDLHALKKGLCSSFTKMR